MSIRRPVGSPTQHDDDPTAGAAGGSRRSFVRNLGIGGAAVAGAVAIPSVVLASAAAAQTPEPVQLPETDVATITALVALETAAVESYDSALAITSLLPVTKQLFAQYRRHHEAHVDTLVAILVAAVDANAKALRATDDPPIAADTAVSTEVINEVTAARNPDDIAAQEQALYQAFYTLEANLASTYLVATGTVEESSVTAALVGIGPVNGQQAFGLGTTLGLSTDEIVPPTQPTAGAYPLPSA